MREKFSREFERKVAVKSEFTGSKLLNSRENFKTRWQVAAGKGVKRREFRRPKLAERRRGNE